MISEQNQVNSKPNRGRLYCSIEKFRPYLFFSLVDYRNSYFTSNDPDKIIEFYKSFESRDQLIEWMKERPKGTANIYEIEGNKEIIVVIPTADFNGKYAKECRESIFKGLHIIFVESGGKGDFYFNLAHNYNIGIRKAVEYNPKWIVVSNDDMYKIDDINVLRNELQKKDSSKFHALYTRPSTYHSIPAYLGIPKSVSETFIEVAYSIFNKKLKLYFMTKRIRELYKVRWIAASPKGVIRDFFFLETVFYILTSSFSIFSGSWAKEEDNIIYNEYYINGVEDMELSLKICASKEYDFIDYKIGDIIGGTLGNPRNSYFISRTLRDLVNWIYLDSRMDSIVHQFV